MTEDATIADQQATVAALTRVRARRAALRDSLDRVEAALAVAAGGDARAWGASVQHALRGLADDFAAHVDVTEGYGGLHEAIRDAEPRLAGAVASLTAEHAVLAGELAGLLALTALPTGTGDVPGVRDRAVRLMGQVVRHRQRGSDLIYEAYATDIGGLD